MPLGAHRHGRNNPFYNKQQNFSEEIKEKHRQSWRDGLYDNVNFGSKNDGHREDLGHFVRSTWEANFARVLNYLIIKYQYEPKRFQTPYGSYCPDFYIPKWNLYIEVKGWEKNDLQRNKRIYLIDKLGIDLKLMDERRYGVMKRKYREVIEWE